ncbi:MAG: DUF1961 family protein [Planctomycetota bacterium]
MFATTRTVIFTFFLVAMMPIKHSAQDMPKSDQQAFNAAIEGDWETVFLDSGQDDWTERWFLDGQIASVRNTASGMLLSAGPRFRDDAHHMVLWTKESFAGDLVIDYEYTRKDFETNCVSILYIQATGSGDGPYDRDIAKWSELRNVPAMRMYFDHMHLYHVSYAAFPNTEHETTDYIRARRYIPGGDGLRGTDLLPDYHDTGLFAPGVPHRITVVKAGQALSMRVSNAEETRYFHWSNDALPPVLEGRIGLRQMFTRSALIRDFRVQTRGIED